jgi:hypothetical protein
MKMGTDAMLLGAWAQPPPHTASVLDSERRVSRSPACMRSQQSRHMQTHMCVHMLLYLLQSAQAAACWL